MKMTKRLILILTAVTLVLMLAGCKTEEQKRQEHEQILQEISDSNRQRTELRNQFRSSDLCLSAEAYLRTALEELVPDATAVISIEPGSDWYERKTLPEEELAKKVTDAESARAFFKTVRASVSIDFWNYGVEAEELCQGLLDRGISCFMAADQYGDDSWIIDSEQGTVEFYKKPGV